MTSLDRAPVSARKTLQKQRQPSFTDDNELERSGSQASINFSYPTGARPNSPSPTRPLSRNQATNGISQLAANEIQNTLTQAPEQPVGKKKRRIASGSTEGTHLASSGGMGGKSLGLLVPASSADAMEPKYTSNNPANKKIASSEIYSQIDVQRDSSAYGSDSDSAPEMSKSKRSQRASGFLTKQPSVVREDWEGEQDGSSRVGSMVGARVAACLSPVGSPTTFQSKKETAISNSSKKIMETSDHSPREARPSPHLITTVPSMAVGSTFEAPSRGHLEVSNDSARPARQTSISPSRSTRFSSHLASEFTGKPRHEPLPRSVSPAKSALKHYSSSPQSTSPVDAASATRWRKTSQASSEASDNASLASGDGFGSKPQRKKSARVSFEADPEVVGVAAGVTPSDTPIFDSPQHKDAQKKGWLGKPKSGHLDSIPAEDELEDFMKPRPVLPSFGSVRGRRDGSAERALPVAEAASPSSSETSTASNLATLDTSISSDHAIGGLLAREALRTQQSKTESSKSFHSAATLKVTENSDHDSRRRANAASSSDTETLGRSSIAPSIPSIAIQPATPGIGDIRAGDQWLVDVPGGFPGAVELEGDSPASQKEAAVSPEVREIATSSPAEAGISEPKPSELVLAEDPSVPPVGSFSESLRQQAGLENDSESGGSSIYSDAAEDLPELEGDGFGSINAIVESPIVGVPANRMATPPDSPLAGKGDNERMGIHARQDSWDEAEAHWRRVGERQRRVDQAQQGEQDAVQNKPRKKKTRRAGEAMASARPAKAGTPISGSPKVAQPPPSAYPVIDNGKDSSKQGPMRRSMRGQSLELSDAPGLRSSLRPKKSPESQVRGPQPSSLPKAALQKRNIPASPAASSPLAGTDARRSPGFSQKPIMSRHRRLSNDSDSSSSFKRSRRPASSGGKFTMRSSMRSSDEQPTSPPALADRGVGPLSPQDRRPFSPMAQGTMRTSMRGSADAGVPTLRKQGKERPSSTMSGFGKSRAKGKGVPPKPLGSKLKSRFAGSDEDVSEVRTFRSRFEDSSDEEGGVVKYRPVRGIPGKPDEGDSTDLDDSSDNGEQRSAKPRLKGPKSPLAVNGLSKKTSVREPEVSSPTDRPMSPIDGKKKGIFGRFRSKKAKDPTRDTLAAITEGEKVDDQTTAELDGARSPEFPASPDSRGKLQRRHTPQRLMSDSWPLSTNEASDTDNVRPHTSDGAGGADGVTNGRPGLGSRQNTSATVRTEGGTPVLGRTGKKKRFPMLRKAFGLHD